MAQQFYVRFIDDIDGTDLGESASVILFAFEGKEYTIDLSDENVEAFRQAMAPYIEAGHRVTGNKKTVRNSAPKTTAGDTKAVREWARANGYTVSDRGRIPAEVANAYAAAN